MSTGNAGKTATPWLARWGTVVAAAIVAGTPMIAAWLGFSMGWWGPRLPWLATVCANLVASVVGIVGGVPIGVSIVRWQEGRAAASAREAHERVFRATRQRVRVTLTTEVTKNQDRLEGWKLKPEGIFLEGFETARWETLRRSTEVAELGIEFLVQVAELYQSYANFNRLHQLLLEAHYSTTFQMTGADGHTAKERIIEDLRRAMRDMLGPIEARHAALEALRGQGASMASDDGA